MPSASQAISQGCTYGETDPMKFRFRSLVVASVAMLAADALTVRAQQKPRDIPASITTPDKVETRIGTMEFKDGMPSKETLDKVYDNLDFTHAFEAFVNTFQGVNMAAIREANATIGVKDNETLFSNYDAVCSCGERGHSLFHRVHRPKQWSHGARDST